MKNFNLNKSISALIFISFLVYFLILIIFPVQEKTFLNYLKIVPNVVTFDSALIFLFSKFIWKWKIFKGWLVLTPNLNGTWEGWIQTTWVDEAKTNERPTQIPAVMVISQSLFTISCVMRTQEMTSYSFISGFLLDEESQMKKLSYSYNSNPKASVIHRSPPHFGTAVFEIYENSERKLAGHYWTSRQTTGDIELKFLANNKEEEFPNYLGNHPVSEIRNNKG